MSKTLTNHKVPNVCYGRLLYVSKPERDTQDPPIVTEARIDARSSSLKRLQVIDREEEYLSNVQL